MTPTTPDPPDKPIDLRQAMAIVWRRKVPILIAAAAVAVLVLIVGSLRADKYEASAQVVLTEPAMTTTLDPRTRLLPQVPSRRGMEDVATAPEILLEVMREGIAEGLLPEDITLNAFAGRCSADLMAENLIVLNLTAPSAQAASRLCNLWAQRFTTRLNALFGVGKEELDEIAERLTETRASWEQAEKALLDILPETRVLARQDRLDQMREALRMHLREIHQINLLISEARTVRRRLELIGDDEAPIDLGSMMSMIGLQGANSGGLDQLQIEISSQAAMSGAATVAEARQTLEQLIESLITQQAELREEVARLEQIVTERIVELEKATHRETVATQRRDLAESAHEAMVNQMAQVQMSMSGNTDTAKIAARATPPATPSSPGSLLLAAAAGVLTLFLAALLSVALPPREARVEG